MSFKIDFFPDAKKQARQRPLVAKLVIADATRQGVLKMGFFSKELVGDEVLDIACHDPKVAADLVKSLRETAQELEAAIVKAANPFAR